MNLIHSFQIRLRDVGISRLSANVLASFALVILFHWPVHAETTPMIAAGKYHTVGLKSDGTVVAVGGNSYGQLSVFNVSATLPLRCEVVHQRSP